VIKKNLYNLPAMKKITTNAIILIVSVQAVIIILLLFYLVASMGDSMKVADLQDQLTLMRDHHEACIARNDSLAVKLQKIKVTHAIPPFLNQDQVEYLQKKGLADPVEDLRGALVANPDLIGRSGVLGGKMGFYFREGIHILNHRWVFAYYEDGHVDGAILLRYTVGENGAVSWAVIDETNH
jgi:hypothetical protein